MSTQTPQELSPFDLKGSLFTMTVMHLNQTDLMAIDTHLGEKISQAPGFFQNVPVIIDLESLSEEAKVDFSSLYELLRNRGMIPVAVRSGSDELQRSARSAGIPILPSSRVPLETKSMDDGNKKEEERAVSGKPSDTSPPKMTRSYQMNKQPIRSGQQVYAAAADLIVLGAVSAGAEVLADGNIHIYAPLRGRALAGVKGDTNARIFCRSLEAELVAIAGNYRVIEQKDDTVWGKSVQIYLTADERLIIEPMSR